jgi:hypothetical protein
MVFHQTTLKLVLFMRSVVLTEVSIKINLTERDAVQYGGYILNVSRNLPPPTKVEKESRENGDGYSRFLSADKYGLTSLKALIFILGAAFYTTHERCDPEACRGADC